MPTPNSAHKLLGNIEAGLIGIASQPDLAPTAKIARLATLAKIGEQLTDYLRDTKVDKDSGELKNPTPDWDKFPLARDFYTQSH